MIAVDLWIIAELFSAYMLGWASGFIILVFKQLMEKI